MNAINAFSVYGPTGSGDPYHVHKTFLDAYRLAKLIGGDVADEETGEVIWETSSPAAFPREARDAFPTLLLGGDPNALAARDAAETEARKWDEAFDWAASELRDLARVLDREAVTMVERDGEFHLLRGAHLLNIYPTKAEAAAAQRALRNVEDQPRDGDGDLPIWSYFENVGDTLHERHIPLAANPHYLNRAEDEFIAVLDRVNGIIR